MKLFGLKGISTNDSQDGDFTEAKTATVDGVSLTVCDSEKDSFRVAIIPYTFTHTNFCNIKVGDVVNIEFDIIGKYLARLMQH